jgi:putative CocE/NonD family hydrolase
MFAGTTRTSTYVRTQDGTRIAVHVHQPVGLPDGEQVPTVLIMTPYFSAMELRHPAALAVVRRLGMIGGLEWAEAFNRYGYACVLMDLRGAATSFGVKGSMLMPDLIRDAADVVDWIIDQPWSNGRVGATGISGVGMTALWLLGAKHPAVRAIAPRFTVFDIYQATHPGGLSAVPFVRDIGRMLRAMDSNRMHELPERKAAQTVLRALVKGLQPVDGPDGHDLLAAAAAEHAANEHFDEDIVAVEYRDDPLPSDPTATLDTQSPFSIAADIAASGTPIYGFAGWFDGCFIKEMVALHNTVQTPGNRLVIGPWGHGGRWYSSPLVDGKRPTDFDHVGEIVRFFDLHLRDIDRGMSQEPRIHFFTMGEERWKVTDTWPLPGVEHVRWYLAEGNTLREEPAAEGREDRHVVDPSTGTGIHGRFGKHLAGGRFPARFPDRRGRDQLLLTYTSPPLASDTEVTGHPIVSLQITIEGDDAGVFVYLEDVDPAGNVRYVTEGALRASRRSVGEAPYSVSWPFYPGWREDSRLVRGAALELAFDLYPVSWLFRAGHAIRVAIGGADKDNFVYVPANQQPILHLRSGGERPSFVELPVVPRGSCPAS